MRRWLFGLNPYLVDSASAVVLCVGSLLWLVQEPDRGSYPVDARALLLTAAVNLPFALRRRAPLAVLVASCAAAFAFHALGYHYGLNNMAPLLALYTVAAHRGAAQVAVGAVLVVGEWTHASDLIPGIALWSAAGAAVMVSACAIGTGASVRLLGERTAQLAELAAQLHEEQEERAQRAIIQERVRIARELHDIVAHHMSVISVQAGLGRYVVLTDSLTAHKTLQIIADTSSEALTEMRRLLSVLRINPDDEDEDLYSAAVGLGSLDALAERMRMAGLTIGVSVEGVPYRLSPGLDLCAYRIVQEALTNVLKHAGHAKADISLLYGTAELVIRVTDDGTAVPQPGGHGLMGMAERVRLFRGTITTGRRPQGGFEVVVTFPREVAE
ncbi:sensor histidine kinase [Nonomuraea sp. NPDC050556]|uniref:sensor histidine kinase n=1 Tax=Nonomuraea sp. NPDC050556 TaxID=3364369 RepID=UPI003792FCEE